MDFVRIPVGEFLIKILNNSDRLQATFEQAFQTEMKKAADLKLEVTPENGMHVALYETIKQNRSQFPNGAFTIKMELPGGGSIETQKRLSTNHRKWLGCRLPPPNLRLCSTASRNRRSTAC